MSDEQDKLRASLEAPKLFGRKRKPEAPEAPEDAPSEDAPEPTVVMEAVADEPAEDTVEPVEAVASVDTVPPVPAPAPIPEPEPTPAPEPTPVPEPTPAPEPTPVPEPTPAPEPAITASMAGPIDPEPVDEPVARAEVRPDPVVPAAPATPGSVPLPAKASEKPKAPRSGGGRALDVAGSLGALLRRPVASPDEAATPLLSAYRAATVTGLVVGGVMVLLTWLALRGCEAARGTSSCGGGPGFLLLIVIFALSVYLGSALLKAFVIADPGSTSFLAVGLVAVIALLVLIKWFDHWIMIIVIPLVAVGSYLGSVWITKTFVEPGDS